MNLLKKSSHELTLAKKNPIADSDDHEILDFKPSFLPANKLSLMNIPKRGKILGNWLNEGSLGFIFGMRGCGKTWFAWELALSIAHGKDFGPWKCTTPRKVLYVDGEMALDSMQSRLKLLCNQPTPPETLILFSHEQHYIVQEKTINLTDSKQQVALKKACKDGGIQVLILDNLSCLFSGVKENEADSWEKILPWLLDLRRQGIAVIIVHHANRMGTEMRGTSRREDAAFFIINIRKRPSISTKTETKGTFFLSEFTKNRDNEGREDPIYSWSFIMNSDEKISVSVEVYSTKEKVYEAISSGITNNKEIAEELGISPGCVSQHIQSLLKEDRIIKHGKGYSLKN